MIFLSGRGVISVGLFSRSRAVECPLPRAAGEVLSTFSAGSREKSLTTGRSDSIISSRKLFSHYDDKELS